MYEVKGYIVNTFPLEVHFYLFLRYICTLPTITFGIILNIDLEKCFLCIKCLILQICFSLLCIYFYLIWSLTYQNLTITVYFCLEKNTSYIIVDYWFVWTSDQNHTVVNCNLILIILSIVTSVVKADL